MKKISPSGITRYSATPSSGQTRDCLQPWLFAQLTAAGNALPCCWHPSIGSLSSEQTINGIMNGSQMKKLRQGLLTGALDEYCQRCSYKPLIEIEVLRDKVVEHLLQPESLRKRA